MIPNLQAQRLARGELVLLRQNPGLWKSGMITGIRLTASSPLVIEECLH